MAELTVDGLTAALYYLDHGCFVVPLCTMNERGRCLFAHRHAGESSVGKVPLSGPGWLSLRLTREQVLERWKKFPDANVGVLLEPSGLLVIDTDSPEAEEEARSLGLPPGPQVKSASGVHHYYRNTTERMGSAIRRGESGKIDILAQHVVGFGSRHRSGEVYELLTSWEQWGVAEAPLWATAFLRDRHQEQGAGAVGEGNLSLVELETLGLPAWVEKLIVTGESAKGDRSSAMWAALIALTEMEVDGETIASVMRDSRYGVSGKPREKGREWLTREMGKARGAVRAKREAQGPPAPNWSDVE